MTPLEQTKQINARPGRRVLLNGAHNPLWRGPRGVKLTQPLVLKKRISEAKHKKSTDLKKWGGMGGGSFRIVGGMR